MNKILDNCLFEKDKDRYKKVQEIALSFSKEYVGNNIPREHIFSIIETYCRRNGFNVHLFKIPIDDEEIWAVTTVKKGCIFVTVNTSLELNKQIFAAAHELYHIYRYIAGDDEELISGSVLTANNANDIDVVMEEKEANAFAALILAPLKQVEQQKKIADVDSDSLVRLVVLIIYFMDCFALPYKAMVIKLYECNVLSKEESEYLLTQESEVKEVICKSRGPSARWLKRTYDNNLNILKDMIEENTKNFYITSERSDSDLNVLNSFLSSFPHAKNQE